MANMTDNLLESIKEQAVKQTCLPRRALALMAVVLPVALAGCASLEPPMSARQAQSACYAAQQTAKATYAYESDMARIADRAVSALEKVASSDGTHPCDREVLAHIQATEKQNAAWMGLARTGLLIGGTWAITESIGDTLVGLSSSGNSYTLNASESASISDVAIASNRSTIATGSGKAHGIGDQQQAGESLIGRDSSTVTETTTTNDTSFNQ